MGKIIEIKINEKNYWDKNKWEKLLGRKSTAQTLGVIRRINSFLCHFFQFLHLFVDKTLSNV